MPETFPDSLVSAVHRAPSDFPSGKEGDVLTVEFTVAGVHCLGLNGWHWRPYWSLSGRCPRNLILQ
jgi:predicted 3-demethylubiquinone-9 3-methyltransferase (glyoxalase superfamily)